MDCFSDVNGIGDASLVNRFSRVGLHWRWAVTTMDVCCGSNGSCDGGRGRGDIGHGLAGSVAALDCVHDMAEPD